MSLLSFEMCYMSRYLIILMNTAAVAQWVELMDQWLEGRQTRCLYNAITWDTFTAQVISLSLIVSLLAPIGWTSAELGQLI